MLERQSHSTSDCYFEQVAFDEALGLLELAKGVVREATQRGDTARSVLTSILEGDQAEMLLERFFPVVSCTQIYALRFVESCRFVENGGYVNCSDDMCTSNSRFTFVLTPDTAVSGSKTVSLGKATKFGLQSYARQQEENRFICEQNAHHHYLRSRTWLRADEEWVAVSPFRSLTYARALRVGDMFLLRSVGQRTNNEKFMTSPPGTDHLELRNSPSMSRYVIAMSDAHGRFLYEP